MKAVCRMVKNVPSLSFPNVGQMSRSRSSAQTLWYHRKGLVIRNKLANYESPIPYGKKAISKQKLWQTDRQTDEGTDRQTDRQTDRRLKWRHKNYKL